MNRRRTWLAIAAVLAVGIGTFQPMYLTIFGADTAAMAAGLTELPYRRLPGLLRLLHDVDRTTPPGAAIAIWAPFREWEGGYGYAFRRAPYLLPAKEVLPMLEVDRDLPTGRYLASAGYIACWRPCPRIIGFRTAWRTRDGELLVRAR